MILLVIALILAATACLVALIETSDFDDVFDEIQRTRGDE